MVKAGGRVVAQGLVGEAEMVVVTALVDWMVVKPMLRVLVSGGAVTLVWLEVTGVDLKVESEVGGGSVTLTLLQDLQHIRWKSGREQ